MNASVPQRNVVFVSYAREDQVYVDRLKDFLEDMVNDELPGFEVWIDRTDMQVGDLWDDKIRAALAATRVAVLMWSFSFKQSDYIKRIEFPELERAAGEGRVHLVPVVVAGVDALNGHVIDAHVILNRDRPLVELADHQREAIYYQVAAKVRDLVKKSGGAAPKAAAVAPAQPAPPVLGAPVAAAVPVAAPTAATAVLPNLIPAIQALLGPDAAPGRVCVVAEDAQGRQAALMWLEAVDGELMLALADAADVAELPWSEAARQVWRDELSGLSRPLGRVDALRADEVVSTVQRLLGRVGLPATSIGLHAELEAAGEADAGWIDGLEDCVAQLLSGQGRLAVQITARAGEEGDDLPLLWLDRRARGELAFSLPADRDLPRDLAIPRELRQQIKASADYRSTQGLDGALLGRAQDLEVEALCEEVEQLLHDAYGLPEDGVAVFAQPVDPA